jgi:D-amino-acid oxidase
VIGLSTALVLSKHRNLDVTIVSKHMPGDYDIEYASPWAGANFMPVGTEGSKLRAFERATWPELDRLCREVPEAGIHYQECKVYGRKKDEGTAVGIWFQELMKEDPWFKDLMPEVGPYFTLASLSMMHSRCCKIRVRCRLPSIFLRTCH